MICQQCRSKKHEECPSKAAQDPSKPSMALSPEGAKIQLTGLCACQHRVLVAEVVLVDAYTTESMNKLVVFEENAA